MMPLIAALTPAMPSVARKPACKLKCAGSMPMAANPVITPLAAPAMAAVASPLSHNSTPHIETPFPCHHDEVSPRMRSVGDEEESVFAFFGCFCGEYQVPSPW